MSDDPWIFGYGSLVWRPAFDHYERQPGYIIGYVRRFWQASTDHRGTPEVPGRVVTLIEEANQQCWGVGYRIDRASMDQVLEELDYREKQGYDRVQTSLYLRDREEPVAALVYIATPGNQNYVGPATLIEIADVVRTSQGPSGTNLEYVLQLAGALEEMNAQDEHVAELARLVAPAQTEPVASEE